MTTNVDSPLTPETRTAWLTGLAAKLDGLDVFDAEDRGIFRGRVQTMSERTTVSRLRELAALYNRPQAGNCSRWEAQRAIADAWIAFAQAGTDQP